MEEKKSVDKKMNPITKGVIITVYTESSKVSSSNRKSGVIKKINPNPFCSKINARIVGYDRRRRLLQYAQELRRANDPQSQRKHKKWKWRWLQPIQRIKLLFLKFRRRNKQWEYERISTENYSDGEGLGNQQSRKKKTRGRRSDSHFCKRLKIFLKEMSHSWKCNRGNC